MNTLFEQLITDGVARLRKAGADTSRYEVRLLLENALGKKPAETDGKICLTPEQRQSFERALELRSQRMPADKIIGRRGFYKYEFAVDENVLSPRPDTEVLLEAALDYIRVNDYKNILEFGVGSGCVILSLLAEIPGLWGMGVDISAAALKVASVNALALGAEKRIKLLNANWNDADIVSVLGQKFDLILSNPPYIPSGEIDGLDREVKDYDPRVALDGGADGLDCYRRLAEIVPALLNAGGSVMLECGEGQAQNVAALFEKGGLSLQQVARDLNGTERCVILKK